MNRLHATFLPAMTIFHFIFKTKYKNKDLPNNHLKFHLHDCANCCKILH